MNPAGSGTMFMQRQPQAGAPSPSLGRPQPIDGPAGKQDQATAGYGDSTQKCGGCEYFDGESGCSKVDGDIDPDGHCKLWEASSSDETAGTETDNDPGDTYPRGA